MIIIILHMCEIAQNKKVWEKIILSYNITDLRNNMKHGYEIVLIISSALGGGLFLAGCDQRDSQKDATSSSATVGTTIDDAVLTAKVKSALISDPDIKSFDLQVETRKGVVQISGFVDNSTQPDRALQIARSVAGVLSVENKMSVKSGARSVGGKIDDSIITTRIKSALLADSTVKSSDIGVLTREGDVQLSGFVSSEAQIQRALEIARSTDGVKGVENRMSIKK